MTIAHQPVYILILICLAGVYAGIQNALAGGGSFITFPALLLVGLNPLAANMTSTIAMFPGQIATSVASRKLISGVGRVSFGQLLVVSLIGGVLGAILLLSTPVSIFSSLVPWLVLFATAAFAYGSFVYKPKTGVLHSPIPSPVLLVMQGIIGIYGGYFGGGIGFLMLAALTIAGQQVRTANASKNMLAMAMNASAVAIFAFSPQINWAVVVALGSGGIVGGMLGSWLIHKLPEKILRGLVVLVGFSLTVWLFVR